MYYKALNLTVLHYLQYKNVTSFFLYWCEHHWLSEKKHFGGSSKGLNIPTLNCYFGILLHHPPLSDTCVHSILEVFGSPSCVSLPFTDPDCLYQSPSFQRLQERLSAVGIEMKTYPPSPLTRWPNITAWPASNCTHSQRTLRQELSLSAINASPVSPWPKCGCTLGLQDLLNIRPPPY